MVEYTLRDPEKAFDAAIKAGRLSDDKFQANYAGRYMYMCTSKAGYDQFKHMLTRKYIA